MEECSRFDRRILRAAHCEDGDPCLLSLGTVGVTPSRAYHYELIVDTLTSCSYTQNMFLALAIHSVALSQIQRSQVTGLLKDAIRELVPELNAHALDLTVAHSDTTGSRTLTGATYTDTSNMTVESCINSCSTQSTTYVYAGVEYGQECCTSNDALGLYGPRGNDHPVSTDCGDTFSNGGSQAASMDCNMACTGNAQETCGAGGQSFIFTQQYHSYHRSCRSLEHLLEWRPATVASHHGTQRRSLGLPWLLQVSTQGKMRQCTNPVLSDSVNARALAISPAINGTVDVETCTTACYNAGYPLAGMEYSTQCCALDPSVLPCSSSLLGATSLRLSVRQWCHVHLS